MSAPENSSYQAALRWARKISSTPVSNNDIIVWIVVGLILLIMGAVYLYFRIPRSTNCLAWETLNPKVEPVKLTVDNLGNIQVK